MGEAEDAVFKLDESRNQARETERARHAKILRDEFQSLIPAIVDNLRKNNWDVPGYRRIKIDGEDRVGWVISSHHRAGRADPPPTYTYILADGTFVHGDNNKASRIEKDTCDIVELDVIQNLAAYPKSVNTHKWLYERGLVKYRDPLAPWAGLHHTPRNQRGDQNFISYFIKNANSETLSWHMLYISPRKRYENRFSLDHYLHVVHRTDRFCFQQAAPALRP